MSVKAIRISKTSFKNWTLHGPIDQALKTTIQCDSVRFVPLHLDVHGEPLELELWIDAEEHDMEEVENPGRLNAPAMAIVQRQTFRDNGIADPGEVKLKDLANLLSIKPILAPAVLTGAGGTDVPGVHVECMVAVLLGVHDEDEDDNSN